MVEGVITYVGCLAWGSPFLPDLQLVWILGFFHLDRLTLSSVRDSSVDLLDFLSSSVSKGHCSR